MPFNYTTGNPDNLVGGNSAAMADIQGPFYDIRAYLNSGALETLARGLLIIGEVRFIAVPAAPALWLPADGAAVSRSTYSVLFTAIGTAFGIGDGVNTFNVPDVAGRALVGAGQAKGGGIEPTPPTRVIGTKWGVNAVVLDLTQIPAHAHTANANGAHSHSGLTGGEAAPDHLHGVPGGTGGYWAQYAGGSSPNATGAGTGVQGIVGVTGAADRSLAHVHSIVSDGNHSHGITNSGGGLSHDNTMPATAIPAYVYAGA